MLREAYTAPKLTVVGSVEHLTLDYSYGNTQ